MADSHIHKSIQQSHEDMRRVEADMAETVRLTRSVIDASRRAMANADRSLARQARAPLASVFILPR
jgi:hypothetical protein